MKDLMSLFQNAKERCCFRDTHEFSQCLSALQEQVPELVLDWDDGAGESWARLYSDHLWIMVHRCVGIAFVRRDSGECWIPEAIAHLTVVSVDSITADEWCVDPNRLRTEFPEVGWHACPDAVDPSAFSLADLYYATV